MGVGGGLSALGLIARLASGLKWSEFFRQVDDCSIGGTKTLEAAGFRFAHSESSRARSRRDHVEFERSIGRSDSIGASRCSCTRIAVDHCDVTPRAGPADSGW